MGNVRPEAYIVALVLAVLSGAAWLCVDAHNSYFTEVAELRRLGARKVEEFWEADSHHAEYFAQQFRTDALPKSAGRLTA